MDGWMDGRMDKWIVEQMMNGWMDRQINAGMDGLKNGLKKDGQMNGQIEHGWIDEI